MKFDDDLIEARIKFHVEQLGRWAFERAQYLNILERERLRLDIQKSVAESLKRISEVTG